MLFGYDSHGMEGKQVKDRYAHLSYVVPGIGIRLATMRSMQGRGARPKNLVYPGPKDKCSERGFLLYVAGRKDELRIRVPTESERRMKRFFRDYVKSQGGLPHSVNMWTTPWR